MKCPLIKEEEIGASEGGKIPCELCALIQEMGKLVQQAKVSETIVAFNQMKAAYSKLQGRHKKCDGCGLCFGGDHIAVSRHVEGIGEVCQWCAKKIKEHGLATFKKRLHLVQVGDIGETKEKVKRREVKSDHTRSH